MGAGGVGPVVEGFLDALGKRAVPVPDFAFLWRNGVDDAAYLMIVDGELPAAVRRVLPPVAGDQRLRGARNPADALGLVGLLPRQRAGALAGGTVDGRAGGDVGGVRSGLGGRGGGRAGRCATASPA